MQAVLIPFWYARWHYTRAFADMLRLWLNTVWFVWHFFSIPHLLRTLFAPWQGIREENTRRSSAEDMAANLVVNLLMRFIGLLMRLFLILFGLVMLGAVVIALPVLLIVWFFLPFILVAGFISVFKL